MAVRHRAGCADAFTTVVDPAGRGAGLDVAARLAREVPNGAAEVMCGRDRWHARELARAGNLSAGGVRLVLDGEEWLEQAYGVVVANSGFYGAGMHIVPTARIDGRLLGILVVRASSRWRLIASSRQVYAGTHLGRLDVEVRRAREVELGVDRPVPVYADGEPVGDPPVTVAVRGGALRVKFVIREAWDAPGSKLHFCWPTLVDTGRRHDEEGQ